MNHRNGFAFAVLSILGWTHSVGQVSAQPTQSGTVQQSSVSRDGTIQRRAQVPVPQPPFGQLSAEHQKYLDSVLNYWEHSSNQIKVYQCEFTRWEYDPVFARYIDPKTGKLVAKTISTGEIKYSAPDKGLFSVANAYRFTPPAKQGEKPQYVPREETMEKWICDGRSVFEYDQDRKRLVVRPIPTDMQGEAIVDGPLPFLFGAKVDKIKTRYWLRVITPEGKTDEYWLQAYPKRPEDAARYKKVEIIIAKEDFLPKAIHIYDVNYDARRNPARTAFTFEDRKVNPFDLGKFDVLKLWSRDFYDPKTPRGWKRETIDFNNSRGISRSATPSGERVGSVNSRDASPR